MAKITKRTLDGLQAGSKPRTEWDDELRGFGVRIMPSGTKTYVCFYRHGGKQRLMKIGRAGALTPDEARRAAAKVLGSVAGGADPAAAKAAKAKLARFGDLVPVFLAEKAGGNRPRRASTLSDYKRYLEDYAKPLHVRPVAEISREEVANIIAKIQGAHSPTVARVFAASLSSFLGWCARRGVAPANVALAVGKPEAPEPRERRLSDGEIAAVWKATSDGSDYSRIIRLLLLSGQRLREIAELSWHEVDLERRLITFDRARVKNRSQHTIPISDPMLAVLERVERREGYLFGKRAGSPFSGFSKGQAELLARLPEDMPRWSPHDLRRTFTTSALDHGIEPHVVHAVTNHLPQGAARHYDYSRMLPQKTVALRRWGQHVLQQAEEESESNVISLTLAK